MNFSSFVGNKDVKRLVSDAFASGRFPHALIIQGEKGSGKRTFARLLANAFVCRAEEKPCGECPACKRAKAGSHPDIRIEEGSGATQSLTVETAKNIILDAYRMPEEADVSVYLLFVENRMPEITQNKLLKLIEEPPANTVFIITITSAESLLPTIRSRSQMVTLRPPEVAEAADYAVKSMGLSMDEAMALAEQNGGNIGMMLEDTDSEERPLDIALDIALAVASKNGESVLEVTAPLIKNKKLFSEVLDKLTVVMRDGLAAKSGSGELVALNAGAVKELDGLSMQSMMKCMEAVDGCKKGMERNANMNLLVTHLCSQLI